MIKCIMIKQWTQWVCNKCYDWLIKNQWLINSLMNVIYKTTQIYPCKLKQLIILFKKITTNILVIYV